MRILIVEDERLVGRAMQAVLSRSGHEVVGVATTAARALRLAERRPAELAFIDVRLAGGCGIALASELSARGVMCVMATGLDLHGDEVSGVALGVLHKPFLPNDLLRTVDTARDALAGRRPERAPPALDIAPPPGKAAASRPAPCGCYRRAGVPVASARGFAAARVWD